MPFFRPFLFLTATFLLTSCGSFIKVQHNPFELEADAIRSYKQKRENRPDKSLTAQQKKQAKAKPSPSRQQYFGRDNDWNPAAALFPKDKAKITTDSEPSPLSEAAPQPTAPLPQPASLQSPDAPLPQHKPVTTGKICYTCNGKGYTFSPASGKGTLCEKCAGRGER